MLKFIKNIFYRKDNFDVVLNPDISNIDDLLSTYKKEATKYKDTDIKRSINLLKKALLLHDKHSDYTDFQLIYRIARYSQSNGNENDVYDYMSEYFKRSLKEDKLLTHMSISGFYQKMAIINYDFGKYDEYLHNCNLSQLHQLLGLCIQGRKNEYEDITRPENILRFIPNSKLNKSLSKLEFSLEDYHNIVRTDFEEDEPILRSILNKFTEDRNDPWRLKDKEIVNILKTLNYNDLKFLNK